MASDAEFQNPAFLFREPGDEAFQQAFAEEKIRSELRMVNRYGIDKGVVTPDLFEAADVVQHAAEPDKVAVFHPGSLPDLLAQGCHPVGVVDLQPDFQVIAVVGGDVIVKSRGHVLAVCQGCFLPSYTGYGIISIISADSA